MASAVSLNLCVKHSKTFTGIFWKALKFSVLVAVNFKRLSLRDMNDTISTDLLSGRVFMPLFHKHANQFHYISWSSWASPATHSMFYWQPVQLSQKTWSTNFSHCFHIRPPVTPVQCCWPPKENEWSGRWEESVVLCGGVGRKLGMLDSLALWNMELLDFWNF